MQAGFGRGAVHPPGASSSMDVNLSQLPGAHLQKEKFRLLHALCISWAVLAKIHTRMVGS